MAYLRLARLKQWAKSVFVLIGPVYWLQDNRPEAWGGFVLTCGLTALAFALASSACYVFNDLADIESDRAHPRKCRRPLASGAISPAAGRIFAGVLGVLAAVCVVFLEPAARSWVGGLLALYVVNVLTYSAALKHRAIADTMSLSMGFVLRVLGGCAAVLIPPSTWLLSVTFFLALLLSFGKRLGERATFSGDAEAAARARPVQASYSSELLRMMVVVSGVATLLTYAGYVSTREDRYTFGAEGEFGFNLLWLTLLPATYGLLRAILLLERGRYDDPTELAVNDRPFQVSALAFGGLTLGLLWWSSGG
ncbi:MAG: UbiA prenyltransferase family protein [Planctomycetota bacterium]